MDHDAGVGERVAHARGASGQKQGAHAGRLAHAPRADGVQDVLHRVVDGQARGHHATCGWRGASEGLFPPFPRAASGPGEGW